MKKFETMINTADNKLALEWFADNASFYTPASPEPLYGVKGYLSIFHWMRSGFSDVQWKLEEMIVDGNKAAFRWACVRNLLILKPFRELHKNFHILLDKSFLRKYIFNV